MYETDVLVVGAGPAGLTLAIDLARRRINFRLIEAAETPHAGSRGKGSQPRTLEIFHDLGVVDQILAGGALYPKLRIHLGPCSFRAGSLGSAKQPTENVPYPNLWMVPQSRMEAILRQRLVELAGQVEFGKSLAAFEQQDDGISVSLSSGETIRARFMVGCDGGRSMVRKTLRVPFEGQKLDEEKLVVADVEVDGLDHSDWHIWPLAVGGLVGLCPLPHASMFQFTSKVRTAGAAIEDVILRATGYRVIHVGWQSIYQPSVRLAQRYRVGNAFLAGDAAHVHPPAGGQGLNTGVQDAYNLGWKLAHVVRGGPASLLDTYESERRPIAASVLGLSKRLHQTPTTKRGDVTNQLALHYRTSRLSSGAAIGTLQPGDRIPDMQCSDGRKLFHYLQGPHATQIITPDGTRILIRPDGYIGHIGSTHFSEYAGQPVLQIYSSVPQLLRR